MADPQKEAIQLMAEEVVRAIRKITDENNRNYVNTQIRNSKTNTVISGGDVYASDVIGLYPAVAGYIADAPSASQQGDPNATRIVLTMNGLADLRIQSATIDTAQIRNLYASYGDFIHLVALDATISGVDVEQVRSDIADVGLLKVNTANIGFGQIKDLVTGTAIITEGVAGKLYIDRLAVTDAQIASLTTGNLIVQGSNDKLYRVYVDANGIVQTELREIEGGDIGSATIAGSNIASNTITNGLIQDNTIMVDKLNVGSLFASQAFVGNIETSLINSATFGDNLDISGNSSITLTNQRLALVVDSSSTSSSLVLTQNMIDAISDQIALEADTIDLSANTTVQITSAGQISASARQNMDLSANNTITINSGSQISATALESIVNSVVGSSEISSIAQQADRIDLIVTSASTASNVVITDTAIAAISDQITLTADKINAVANEIDLTGNQNIQIYSGSQLSATARAGMDLSANSTIQINSASQISASAIEGIDLTSNGLIQLISQTNDLINAWFTFGETFQVRKPNASWYTETSNEGFYVKNNDVGQAIAAFEGLAAKVQSLIVGNNANLRVIDDGNGGMAWVDM